MPEKINRNEVQTLSKSGAQLVEVLGAEQYKEAHLPGAIHLSLWDLDARSAAAAGLTKERPIIVYCHDYQ